jgi:phosphatidylserine decarboxylase
MQYDTDDTGRLSHLELTSMLDSLGSTLSRSTVNSFFTRNGMKPLEDEITIETAIQCLETELCRPNSEKRRLDAPDDPSPSGSSVATPLVIGDEPKGGMQLGELNFSGMAMAPAERDASAVDTSAQPSAVSPYLTEPMQQPLLQAAKGSGPAKTRHQGSNSSSDTDDAGNGDDSFERVINVKNCPLCHRPRLKSKAEMDIVTHLAVCASSDWAKVDQIMVGNFVTASQAQRKWYTKVISKVSSGNYRLGAVSGAKPSAPCSELIVYQELCQYHCAESHDRAIGRGEDASVRQAWHQAAV